MVADGRLTDEQPLGNAAVGKRFRHQSDYFYFTRGEGRGWHWPTALAVVVVAPRQVCERSFHQRGLEPDLVGIQPLDGAEQMLDGIRSKDQTPHAKPYESAMRLGVPRASENQNRDVLPRLHHLRKQLHLGGRLRSMLEQQNIRLHTCRF